MTQRLQGSPDILARESTDGPTSINFVTSHDGFTLNDLVSYEHRHNWDNGEQNRDGHQHNLSCNWGHEGPTTSAEIHAWRLQTMRNFIATLALSRGVPMLSHGDEVARTQLGNNNAYCQDNPLTWLPWEVEPYQREIFDFTRTVFALRRELEIGASDGGQWIAAHAGELSPVERGRQRNQPFGWLRRHASCETLTIFNSDDRGHLFKLPHPGEGKAWHLLVNTAQQLQRRLRGSAVRVPPRALLLLKLER